ncbi:coil containing protein [Vibrio phage 1.243.O._10N.261.54.B5]|nr:coil containing protein [Vibrio phage 1.243.O._10N.261.54.B5]
MSNKRMNHVFNEMVVKAGRDIDTAELQFINGGVSATFFCTQQAIHAAHAINNHDRMVEEIAELREFVCSLQLDVSNEIKLENLLAKLNQEGEG